MIYFTQGKYGNIANATNAKGIHIGNMMHLKYVKNASRIFNFTEEFNDLYNEEVKLYKPQYLKLEEEFNDNLSGKKRTKDRARRPNFKIYIQQIARKHFDNIISKLEKKDIENKMSKFKPAFQKYIMGKIKFFHSDQGIIYMELPDANKKAYLKYIKKQLINK